MFSRTRTLAASVVAGLLLAGSAQAAWSTLTRVNHLTFSHAVSLPGVVLGAGSYAFESGFGGSNPNVVRVTTRDGRKLLFLGLTTPVSRPRGTIGPIVSLGEAPAGEPMPIAAWYPAGSDSGHQFRYR